MFKYKGIVCPHCGKEFKETDEILICPECGAPYHRDCIHELGKCKFQELHEKGESWQPPQKAPHEEAKEESKYDSHISHRCPRCGTVNEPDKLFCEVCGTPLNPPDKTNGNTQNQEHPGWNNADNQQQGQAPFHSMSYNPYTTPFGGLDPDESIDEVPVKDLAIYIGQNTHYFLPKFKDMTKRNKFMSWNWSAFFLDFYYLFYRKMWGTGIFIAIVTTILTIPNFILMYAALAQQMNLAVNIPQETLEMLLTLNNIFYVISLGLKISVGAFSNLAYRNKVFRSIEKIQKEKPENYSTRLSEKGGVSIKVVIICLVVHFVLSFLNTLLMFKVLGIL